MAYNFSLNGCTMLHVTLSFLQGFQLINISLLPTTGKGSQCHSPKMPTMCRRAGGLHFLALCNEVLPCHICLQALGICTVEHVLFFGPLGSWGTDPPSAWVSACTAPANLSWTWRMMLTQLCNPSCWDSGLFCFVDITSLVLTD